MRKLRVAVISTHPLFGYGIARLLAEDPTVDVSCHIAEHATDPGLVAAAGIDAFVIEDCEDPARTECFIQALPPALVAVVRLRDNAMEVYRGRRRILSPASNPLDLLAELPGRTVPPAGPSRPVLHHRSAS